MERRYVPRPMSVSLRRATKGTGRRGVIFAAEAVSLNVVALGEPAHADVLIAISRDDVPLVGREQECRKKGRVPEDERAIRGVFVCGERAAF